MAIQLSSIADHSSVTYADVTSLASLEAAFQRVCQTRSSHIAGPDGKSIDNVDSVALVAELHEALDRGTFRPGPVREAIIRDAHGTARRVVIEELAAHVVGRAVGLGLTAFLESSGATNTFPRTRCGSLDAACMIADAVAELGAVHAHFIKLDIAACFGSLEWPVLRRELKNVMHDRRLRRLVMALVERAVIKNGIRHRPAAGVHPGASISPVLCNIYLAPLDRVLATRARDGVTWFRYVDDLLGIVPGPSHIAQRELVRINQEVERVRLKLAPEKTAIHRVDQGVDFIGFNFRVSPHLRDCELKVSARNGTALAANLRDLVSDALAEGVPVTSFVESLRSVLCGWKAAFCVASDSEDIAERCGHQSLKDWLAGDLRLPIDHVEKRALILGRSLWGRSGSP